jgi:hypothetical protein
MKLPHLTVPGPANEGAHEAAAGICALSFVIFAAFGVKLAIDWAFAILG